MHKGISLHIGLNAVDPAHYGGWSGKLTACEADADDMAAISSSRSYEVTKLLTKEATLKQVTAKIEAAAKTLQAGDIFFLSYSGHGGQLPDGNNDEDDGMDETWCLYDGELIDDQLYALLGKFAAGVRVIVLSDSCHSGTVIKEAYYHGTAAARTSPGESQPHYRAMPMDVALKTYRLNKAMYDPILEKRSLAATKDAVKAAVILISGCQDNQYSSDGAFNGLFTSKLLKAWNNGTFKKGYRAFHKQILRYMPPDQTPKFFRVGPYDRKFEAQIPFTV